MAALQGINSADVRCGLSTLAAGITWSDLRVDAGVAPQQLTIGVWFWRLMADCVLDYKACPAVVRWLLPLVIALTIVVLCWIVRLAPYWVNR